MQPNCRYISLGEAEIFEFISLKTGWTKEYYSQVNTDRPFDIPVYTAAKDPVAFVKIETTALITASTKQPVLSFASNGDGSAGTNLVYHTRPFYVSNDRTCLKINDEKVIPEYVFYKLLNIKAQYGFDFQFKATPKNIKPLIQIEIPIGKNSQFDITKQIELVEKYKKVLSFKEELRSVSNLLEDREIAFTIGAKTKNISLSDKAYFELSIGERILKKDISSEGIPAFSANVYQPFGYIAKSNLKEFSKPTLIWGIDGIFDWGYIEEGKEFATTDHCGSLRINNINLYPKYVYYALKSTKDQYGFDRTYRASLTNIKDMVSIEVPVNQKGEFDFDLQKQIAAKYEKFLLQKERLQENLKTALSVGVSFQ